MDVAQFTPAVNKFGLELFKKVHLKNIIENTSVSPISVFTALAMLHLGARGTTAESIARALQWGTSSAEEERKLHEQIRDCLNLLVTPSGGSHVALANRVYVDKQQNLKEEFKVDTKHLYLAESREVDFRENAGAERASINAWVSEQTQNKIQDLLSPGVVSSSTRLVLVNALYFKGQWQTKFREILTRPRPFKVEPGVTKEVPTMVTSGELHFARDDHLKCRAVGLPYIGGDVTMAIIVPDDDFGLDAVVDKLTHENLSGLLARMHEVETKVSISLPKFELSCAKDLNYALSSLGMSDAFCSGKANFSRISETSGLSVDAVAHKVYVKVDEEGTQAAAATFVVSNSFSQPPIEVWVDHPFLFVISDRRIGGAELFIGAVMDPEQ